MMTTELNTRMYGWWSRAPGTDRYEKSYGIEPLYKPETQPLYEKLYK
jgi:hypothetical protein